MNFLAPIKFVNVLSANEKDAGFNPVIGAYAWHQFLEYHGHMIESLLGHPLPMNLTELSRADLTTCLSCFVEKMRKPNGKEYQPDTIYYFTLAIQNYLQLYGKKYKIFSDTIFERFTNKLDTVVTKFMERQPFPGMVITHIHEKYLWYCGLLGVGDADTLLHTLIYFNTKYLGIHTLADHMLLTVPQMLEKFREKNFKYMGFDVLTCPFRLFELYVSKCRHRYCQDQTPLYLEPDRRPIPKPYIWYSPRPLAAKALSRILNRFLTVKEINFVIRNMDSEAELVFT